MNLHGCVRLCCDARMRTVGMDINAAISRIVHLCAQSSEFFLPPYILAQTHTFRMTYMHIKEIHRDNQKSGVTEMNRIIQGFMLLSWWTINCIF